jgi:hypothetical protein
VKIDICENLTEKKIIDHLKLGEYVAIEGFTDEDLNILIYCVTSTLSLEGGYSEEKDRPFLDILEKLKKLKKASEKVEGLEC